MYINNFDSIATPWLLYILDLVEDLVGNLTNDEKVAFKNGLFMLFRKLKGTQKEGAARGISNDEITQENVNAPPELVNFSNWSI